MHLLSLTKNSAITALQRLKRKTLSSRNEIERNFFELELYTVLSHIKNSHPEFGIKSEKFEEIEDFEDVQKAVKKISLERVDIKSIDQNKVKETIVDLKRKMANSSGEIEFAVFADELENVS
jgi:hypothetical protein